jgi:hypothetical protein
MNAEKARDITKEVIQKRKDNALPEIFRRIEEAAKYEKNYIHLDGAIEEEYWGKFFDYDENTLKTLESLGYKIAFEKEAVVNIPQIWAFAKKIKGSRYTVSW